MRELVLPFTCRQLKWFTLIIFPIIGIYGILTINFPLTVIGGGIGIGCWICQIIIWLENDNFEFNIRCKCE